MTENLALQRPLRYCKQPACPNKTRNENAYCDAHQKDNTVTAYRQVRQKDPVDKAYFTARWRNYRLKLIEQNFQCQRIIGFEQCMRLSRVVHHLISPRDRMDLMYDPSNCACLCDEHHPGGVAGTPDWQVGRDYVATVFALPTF